MSRSGQPPDLKKYMDKKLQIKLNANRVVVGTLRGFDQFMNLVVDNTLEVSGSEKNDIGMVGDLTSKGHELNSNLSSLEKKRKDLRQHVPVEVIRGNSVVMIEALEPVSKT